MVGAKCRCVRLWRLGRGKTDFPTQQFVKERGGQNIVVYLCGASGVKINPFVYKLG